MNLFFNLVSPFIDPVTRNKMKFNPSVVKDGIFAPDNVMKDSFGGDVSFVYDHDKYWPALVQMSEERSKNWRERWRTLGGTVGVKELDYKTSAEKLPSS